MSLLMQALKTAEQLKQKQSAAATDNATKQELELPAILKASEIPAMVLITPYLNEPTASEPSSITTGSVRIEPELSLSPRDLPTATPGVEVDLRQEGQAIKPASAPKSASIKLDALPVERVGFAAPPQTPPPPSAMSGASLTATPVAIQSTPPETISAQQLEKANESNRINAPRTGQEQKQAAAQAAERVSQDRKKAKSVFESKLPERSSRMKRFLGIGLIVFILCAGGGYYYLQTTPQNVGMTQNGAPQKPVTTPIAPLAVANQPTTLVSANVDQNPASPASAPSSATVSGNSQASNAQPPVSGSTQNERRETSAEARPDVDRHKRSATPPAPARAASTEQKEQTAQIKSADEIQIHKGFVPETTNATLTKAYQSFSSGNIDAARLLYESVLRQDPNNRDALLGMAAIAVKQKQPVQAGSFYSKLLDLDPMDPEAIAGLTSLRRGDPEQSESQLKKVLTQSPESGATLFELGNLYARQSRWADAQQLYFRAFGTASGNADYAYNLAVSLDHLGQKKLALEYYQRAVVLTKQAPGNFDRPGAQNRVDQLQQAANIEK